jgi:hypothetical protein
MKIIVNESQYSTLINEDMGVSRASIDYANVIYEKLLPIVIELTKKKQNSKEKIVIGLKELSRVWKKDLDSYLEFPIQEIRIDLILTVKSKMSKEFATGGGAEQIESSSNDYSFIMRPSKDLPKYILSEIDDVLNVKFEFSINIRKDFSDEFIDGLMYDLMDTISHECNHMLEFYQRYSKGASDIDTTLVYSGQKNYNIPKDIYKIWQEFSNMLYFSEPYEMRAMVQEMYGVRLRQPFEEFKNHRYYKSAEIMENFDADVMFDFLVEEIEKHNPDSTIIILKNLFNWFKKDYSQHSAELGVVPNKRIEKTTHILDLMKAFQPRIKNAGKKLRRKFNKLYSLSPD